MKAETKLRQRPFIVGLGGTMRQGSQSELALAVSLSAAQKEGAETLLLSGPDLMLPMYTPGAAHRDASAAIIVAALRRSDGIIIASPSYHGSLSGLVKNALDYTEDLRDDQRVYLDGRAVGCVACADGWQGGAQTLTALRAIAHALRAWPTPLGVIVNTCSRAFDESGNCLDEQLQSRLAVVGRQVVEFAQHRIGRGTRSDGARYQSEYASH